MTTSYDENFLVRNCRYFHIDKDLPLRIQKRSLLKFLGFPQNLDLKSCTTADRQKVSVLIKEYLEKFGQFLIIVSEKPMHTLATSLFVVKSKNKVIWRDNHNATNTVSICEVLEVISRLEPSAWLEFSPCIWSSGTMGGRLMYVSEQEQVMEMQEETVPAQLLTHTTLALYSGKLEWFDLNYVMYMESVKNLSDSGFQYILPFHKIKRIITELKIHQYGFRRLSHIASVPTLEFAITKSGTMISLDIDWAEQWTT